MTDQSLNMILKGRAAMYEYFYSAFYKVPDENFFKLTGAFINISKSLASESNYEETKTGALLLAKFGEYVKNKESSDILTSLNVSFTKLFIAGNRVADRESRRRDKEINVTDTILSITDFFAYGGVVKPTLINMPLDSFCMELFYMFKTSQKAMEEGLPVLNAQSKFLHNHLGNWSGDFLDDLFRQCTKDGADLFYGGLVLLCSGFIKDDMDFVDALQ